MCGVVVFVFVGLLLNFEGECFGLGVGLFNGVLIGFVFCLLMLNCVGMVDEFNDMLYYILVWMYNDEEKIARGGAAKTTSEAM